MTQGAVKTAGKRSQAVSAKKHAILSAALETFSQFGIHGTRLEQVAEQAGVRNFRKHILWYTKGLRHSAALRQQLGSLGRGGEMLAVLQAYFEDMNKMNNGLDFS